jgi:hypothetical protein
VPEVEPARRRGGQTTRHNPSFHLPAPLVPLARRSPGIVESTCPGPRPQSGCEPATGKERIAMDLDLKREAKSIIEQIVNLRDSL